MDRAEMVNARKEQLSKLSDVGLVSAILDYFEGNRTMPGEKNLKLTAQQFAAEFDEGSMTGILTDYRNEMIDEFASILVKEVRMKNVTILSENRKNKDVEGLKVSCLPMELIDTKPGKVLNTVVNTYGMDAFISTGNVAYGDGSTIADIPEGFQKNHPGINGMKGTVIVTDHSNGKFANMSYRMFIDLGQELAA